ncbi:transcriptional regulator [Avrilella dinanensis]|uniref:Uncharacterized protein n=1 Tax=Avrilella dinanensis TaxID=2008672 RepID=A0A2M9R5D4_9FLAO|nr:transcriptional regulator [Avrilella dinanensis]PJR03983.1 hypothetical protein CDL10_05150 [Avrilella dinanensis]
MIAIITGDIINSRTVATREWLPVLESVLSKFGDKEKDWEIFRGDSFQLEVAPENVIKTAIYLKTTLKTIESLDLRIGVGIGEKNFSTATIKESNGEAFVFSGEAFEELKKRTFSIKTRSEKTDQQINLIFDLLMVIMDKWNTNVSKTVRFALDFPDLTQTELAGKMNKKQSQISRELNKAGFEEVLRATEFCQYIINDDGVIYS